MEIGKESPAIEAPLPVDPSEAPHEQPARERQPVTTPAPEKVPAGRI